MGEVVAAPPRGLELFGTGRRRKPLRYSGKRAEALGKLGVSSVQDLLQHYPRRHVDRSTLRTIAQLREAAADGFEGEITVHARVVSMNKPFALRPKGNTRKRRTMIKGTIGDETGKIGVTWFNQDWVGRALQPNTEAFFYGRLGVFAGKLQMTAPRFELVRTGREPFNVGRIIPIYPATAEFSSDQIRKVIWETLEELEAIMDPTPEDIVRRHRLMGRGDAIRLIHFPDNRNDVLAARDRLVFDEVFTLQLGLVYRKRKLERTVQGISHERAKTGSLADVFVAELPFELTAAQRKACEEVASDMARPCPMHRLVEGEVGSGKTVVALFACLLAIENGRQAALMAPTEVLAEQHHLTVTELLDRAFGADEARNLFAGISRRPVVRLLTGSTPAAQREQILAEVATGEVNLLIGTHALIQEAVAFEDLSLAVVDEQHRFGVHQRKSLREKRTQKGASSNERRDPKGTGRVPGTVGEPDILVMTATPIPRTLAVTIYGDLDVSILDELPTGRQPITTTLAAGQAAREEAYGLIRSEVSSGRQAFIVYALRDESDKTELRSAKAEAKRLAAEVFPDLNVGLVHGDMRADEKEAAMSSFRSGETEILVATTVVEVGVDVPNATVMLIEDAERFGLAQLHQLRGRIGRGQHPSYCVLATDLDLSKEDDPVVALALERLRAVVETSDGFKLSLVDLQQRGEGQLFGARQSGMPQLKMVRVLQHQDIVKAARDEAVAILDADPDLGGWEHQALAREMRDRFPEGALDVIQSG